MIRINLVSHGDIRKKENVKKSLFLFVLVLVIFAVALLFVHKWLSDNINSLNSKISHTKSEIDKYNKINEEIEELRAYLELLNTKLGVIASLQANRSSAVNLLDNLTKVVVADDMWLTELTTSGNASANVKGIATDNKIVADFMVNLETMPKYTQVSLASVKQIAINNRPLKEFVLKFNLATAKQVEEAAAAAAVDATKTGGKK